MNNDSSTPQDDTRIILDSLLAMAKNSVGSGTWRAFYAMMDGTKKEVTQDGALSCAYFVSSLLHNLALIQRMHMTVDRTVEDMEQSGWFKLEEPRAGAVIVYDPAEFENGEQHAHIGIYIGDEQAVSNSEAKTSPQTHHWKMQNLDGSERAITGVYWHSKLDQYQ